MLLRSIRWVKGYVLFQGDGMLPERFLNLAARAGIELWQIESTGGILRARTACKNYKRLRPLAVKSRMRLRVKGRKGLPFYTRRYRGRFGLLAGAAVFAVTLWLLPQFVWGVQVHGNVTLNEDEVKNVMAELGVAPGAMIKNIDAELIEQSAMVRLPDVSWMAINIQGSEVTIELKERAAPPNMIPDEQPCNMVAGYDGQILRLEVYTGSAAVKEGEAVVKGQLLISGVQEDETGAAKVVHASGRAIASTRRTLKVEVPLQQDVVTATGKTIVRRRIRILGAQLPLNLAVIPEGYVRRSVARQVQFGEIRLPVTIYEEIWEEQKTKHVTLSPQEAEQQARLQIETMEQSQLQNVTIKNKEEQLQIDENSLQFTVYYTCEEDIAVENGIVVTDS